MTSPASLPEYLTLDEVAAHYRASVKTCRHWRLVGYGPRGVKVGTRVLYPVHEVERFDAELRAACAPEGDAS